MMRLRSIIWKRRAKSLAETSERQDIMDGIYACGGQCAQLLYNAQDGTGTVQMWMIWYGRQTAEQVRKRYEMAADRAYAERH